MSDADHDRIYLAGLFLAHYLWLTTIYRTRTFASEQVELAIPSSLYLKFAPDATSAPFFLNYVQSKAVLFLWMMVCLVVVGLLYFSYALRPLRGVLALLSLQCAFLVFGEQRVWLAPYCTLLLLTLTYFLTVSGKTNVAKAGFSVWLFGCSLELSSLFYIGCGAEYLLAAVLALSASLALWSRKMGNKVHGFALVILFFYGWLTGQVHLCLLVIFMATSADFQDSEGHQPRALFGVALLLCLQFVIHFLGYPNLEHWKFLHHRGVVALELDVFLAEKPVLKIHTERISRRGPRFLVVEDTAPDWLSRSLFRGASIPLLNSPHFYEVLKNRVHRQRPDARLVLESRLILSNGEVVTNTRD